MRPVKMLLGLTTIAIALGLITSAAAFAEPEALPFSGVTFTGTSGAGKYVSKNGLELKCSSGSGSGEFTSAKTGTSTATASGCTGPLGVKCTGLSNGTAGQITGSGEFKIVKLLGGGVGVAGSGSESHFSCGSILSVVRGCTAAKTTTEKSNTGTQTLKQSKGVAENTDYMVLNAKEEEETVSCILETSTGGGKFEQSATEGTSTITFAGGVEVEIMG